MTIERMGMQIELTESEINQIANEWLKKSFRKTVEYVLRNEGYHADENWIEDMADRLLDRFEYDDDVDDYIIECADDDELPNDNEEEE